MRTPVLHCENICLSYADAQILSRVQLDLFPGEIHLLLGENGTGKTSLVRILSGVIPFSSCTGNVIFRGERLNLRIPQDALSRGIVTIHQDPSLYEELTVAENLYANVTVAGVRPFTSKKQLIRMAAAFFEEHHIDLDPALPVGALNIQLRRKLELVKLYLRDPAVLILDEPVATLSSFDMDFFLELLGHFMGKGTAILCVAHNFAPFQQLVGRFSILNGRGEIRTYSMTDYERGEISSLILDDFCQERYPKIRQAKGPEVFCAEHLCAEGGLADISFELAKGEILGFFGRAGSGRELLSRALFGLVPITGGELYVDRLPARITSPAEAIDLGIAYVTEDRYENGLFGNLSNLDNVYSIRDNSPDRFWTHTKREYRKYREYSERLNFRAGAAAEPEALSGGQQQRLILMRWLLTTAKVYIFNEPTQSIDVPSKIDVYNMFNQLVMKGSAILLFSSNLEELMGICDRVLFIGGGKITGEVDYDHIQQYRQFI